jgi:hypothetical protein
MMKISKKKPYITSSVTTMKSGSIKGFPRFTGTDVQRVKATPKRQTAGSNPVRGAKTPDIAKYRVFLQLFCGITFCRPEWLSIHSDEYSAYKFSAFWD